MSFKSQKSWNEEISEIWEKSYSVRSVSEESLTCEDEPLPVALSRSLLKAMNPAVLSQLRKYFTTRHIRSLKDVTRKVEEMMRRAAAEEGVEFKMAAPRCARAGALWIDERTFVNAINTVFGHHKYEVHAHHLFRSLDPLSTRQASWLALLERLAAVGQRRTSAAVGPALRDEDITVTQLPHCKRETLVKMVQISSMTSHCTAAVTRGGRVGVYHEARLLRQYQLWYHRSGHTKRVKNCWVTDAIYMSDVQYLAISASDRSLTFYDASVLTHTPVYCLTGIPNIPTCLSYEPSLHKMDSSELAFGDERGDVTRMLFLQPRVCLLHKNYADKINYYFWKELSSPPHDAYLSLVPWYRVHKRSVRRIQHLRDKDAIISCSHDSTNSVVMRHRRGKIKDYVFNVARGVHAFSCIPRLELLATASGDGARLWHVTQGAPYATLGRAHVIDIIVLPREELVVTFNRDCTVDIWHLYEESLLQTIKIKFPFLGILGMKVEFGNCSIYPGPPDAPAEEDSGHSAASSRRSSLGVEGGAARRALSPPSDVEDEFDESTSSPTLLVCSRWYVCALRLRERRAPPPPPPGDAREPSLPQSWGACRHLLLGADLPPPVKTTSTKKHEDRPSLEAACLPQCSEGDAREEAGKAGEADSAVLDDLLEKAGLQGILEKDFVLLMGLKHDLNQKISELKTNMDQMSLPVRAGAPYLALRLHEPAPPPPPPPAAPPHAHIVSQFPSPEHNATTSRRSKSISSDNVNSLNFSIIRQMSWRGA